MPEGVLDVLKPFVDFAFPVEGVEYRKAIYILLGWVAYWYIFTLYSNVHCSNV